MKDIFGEIQHQTLLWILFYLLAEVPPHSPSILGSQFLTIEEQKQNKVDITYASLGSFFDI